MPGEATIASDVLGRYAADAACEVEGVRGLVANQLHRHRGVRVTTDEAAGTTVELHLDLEWGTSIPTTARVVQQRVADYLERMAGSRPRAVEVIVDAIGPAQ